MKLHRSTNGRRGAVLPLVVLCSVALIGLIALAVDIGMVAVARSQCQNAADTAAMAGARTINGNEDSDYNLGTIPGNTVAAAIANQVLGKNVEGDVKNIKTDNAYTYSSGKVKVEVGAYTYLYDDDNAAKEGFQVQIPRTDTAEPYSAVRATVDSSSNYGFGRIFGLSTFNANATAVAVHRPRDVVIIMDMSGSMRFESLGGVFVSNNVAYPNYPWYPRTHSLNPDSIYPQFGHYSDTTTAGLQGTSSYLTPGDEQLSPSNIVATANSGPPVTDDWYSNAAGTDPSASNRAFTRAADSYATSPGGDNFLKTQANTTTTYAKTVNEVLDTSSSSYAKRAVAFENYGYKTFTNATFNGYTQGPAHWGKTFFVWPPDPAGPATSTADATNASNHYNNGAKDWRKRFFFKYNTSTSTLDWLDHTIILFDPSGAPATASSYTPTPIIKTPGTNTTVTENGVSVTYTYKINYAAILYWLNEVTPKIFPATLQAGRIRYYSSLPSYSDSTLNNRWWTTYPLTDNNERFWKDYIDYVLGLQGTGAGTYTNRNIGFDGAYAASTMPPLSSAIGNGDYYSWGTVQISQKPDILKYAQGLINNSGGYATSSGYSANLNIDSMPADPDPTTSGWFVRFFDTSGNLLTDATGTGTTGHMLYRVTTVNLSSGSTSSIRINTGHSSNKSSTNGLQAAVADNGVAKFYNYQVGLVNNSGGYAVGAGYSSDINVRGLPYDPDVANGAYVRFANDSSKLYYITQVTTTSGRVTGFRINDGTDQGLRTAISNNLEISFYPSSTGLPAYTNYSDNPYRARHQFWFGPMTFLDWLGNYTTLRFWWPGNVHEAQGWACKVGIQTAIDDIKKNHPSDFIGMAFFSSPKYSGTGGGQHNRAIVPLGRNYQQLKDSLWFPPSTVTGTATEITPFDADFNNVPRAKGGTCPGMGFMVAYNLLSSNISNLRTYSEPKTTYRGTTGGLGRKGASRLIIFETDGAPNTRAYVDLKNSGSDAYYPVRLKYPENYADSNNEWPSGGSYANSDVYTVVEQICKTEANSGYSTTRKPVLVYPLAFGSLFEKNNTSQTQTDALTFMQTVANKGNTAKTTTGSDFPDWQRIYGTNDERISRMKTAFTTIMQSGVQVSLIE